MQGAERWGDGTVQPVRLGRVGVAQAGSVGEGGTQLRPELRRLRPAPVRHEALCERCGARASLPKLACSVPPPRGLDMSRGGSVYTTGIANMMNQVPFLPDFKILVSGDWGSWCIFILFVLLIRLSVN